METIKTIDTDLASLHGYLCGDGYVITHKPGGKKKYYRIGLRNTEKALLQDFQNKFFCVFGIKPTISKKHDRCYLSSKKIYYLLTHTFGSFYCAEWKFPQRFKSKNLKSSWLRSLFDCDGWVSIEKETSRAIAIELINLPGIHNVQKLLKDFKIESKFKIKKKGKIFRVEIFGKNNLVLFSEKIGFLHPKKKSTLQKAIGSYQIFEWVFPSKKNTLKKFVLEKLKGKSGKINKKRIKICSIVLKNLKQLQFHLNKIFKVHSIISKEKHGSLCKSYFELSINPKKDIKKLVLLS